MKIFSVSKIGLAGLLMPFFVALEANAQTQTGLRLGLNAGRVQGTDVKESLKTGLGYNLGLFARIKISDVQIQPELVVSGRSYSFSQNLLLDGGSVLSEKKVNSTYLDIPLLLVIGLSDNLNLVVGPQASLNVGNKQKITVGDQSGEGYIFNW